MDQEEKIRVLTEKFLSNEASKEETRLLYFYLSDERKKDSLYKLVDKAWEERNEILVYDNSESEALFSKIKQSIDAERTKENQRFIGQYGYLKYAASVLLAIGIMYGFYANWGGIKENLFPIATIEVTNDLKTEKTILLSDGSVVMLNIGSRLRYPEKFNSNARDIFLEGEAYFEVVKNKERPFVVHSASLKTTVLGTKFNIKAYPGDDNIKITLTTGEVEVALLDSTTGEYDLLESLTPNQQILYDKTSGKFRKTEVDAKNSIAWLDDLLIFEDTQVKEVMSTIGRKYGVEVIILDESIQNCSISVQFDKKPLEDLLNVIALLVNAEYKINGNQVTFSGKGCEK